MQATALLILSGKWTSQSSYFLGFHCEKNIVHMNVRRLFAMKYIEKQKAVSVRYLT